MTSATTVYLLKMSSRPSPWGFSMTSTPSVTALLILFLIACSGDVSEGSSDCYLVTDGRLGQCTTKIRTMILEQKNYTNEEVIKACERSQLQQMTKCLQVIITECEEVGDVDPKQIVKLRGMVRSWQARLDDVCKEMMSLLQPTGGAALSPAGSRSPGMSSTWLLAFTLLALAAWTTAR